MSRTSWGFPKGKVNKDESAFDCAVREVRGQHIHCTSFKSKALSTLLLWFKRPKHHKCFWNVFVLQLYINLLLMCLKLALQVLEETGFDMSFFADPDAYLEHNFQDHQVIKHMILMLTTCMFTVTACVPSLLQACDYSVLCTIISVVEVHVL